jgi:hypothetical protein
MPAPTAVLLPCSDMPEHALRVAIVRRGIKKYLFDDMTIPFDCSNRVDLNKLKVTVVSWKVCVLDHIKKMD